MTVEYQIRYYNTELLREAEMRGEPIDRDDWLLYEIHPDGKTAAARVEELKTSPAFRAETLVIVRYDPAAGNRNWRTRELTRLFDGTYKLVQGTLPIETPEEYKQDQYRADIFWQENYAGRTFHDMLMAAQPHHFAHLSQSDEKKIAFTADDAKGKRDKQTVLSAFTYVDRYLNKHWPQAVQSLFFDAIGGFDLQLLYAETGKDMAAIYQECDTSRTVGSCMSHAASSYDTYCIEQLRYVHPVEAYAGGDLKLAYVRENGDTGAIWGRALVWPDRGTYGRIYSSNAALFRKALKAAGYTSGEDSEALEGARLKLIRLGGADSKKFVLPYIDYNFAAEWDEDESLTICEGGNIGAEGTCGSAYLDARDRNFCEWCEEYTHEDVQTVRDRNNREILACDPCVENSFLWCEDCDTSHHVDVTKYSEVYGRSFCDDCYSEAHGNCDNCDEECRSEDVSWHEDTTQSLCNDCYSEADIEEEKEEEEETPATEEATHAIAHSGQIWPIVTEWNGWAAPDGYCFYSPPEVGQAPPYWIKGGMMGQLVHPSTRAIDTDASGFRTFEFITIGDDYRYLIPIEAITGQPAHTQEALAA
jgi:hypothetical protein